MKIVDISEFYSPTGGGVRNYVDHKFKAAARHGHSLTVIAPGTENRVEMREGGKLVWVETPQLPFDRNYRMFWGAEDVWRISTTKRPTWWKVRRPGAADGSPRDGRARREDAVHACRPGRRISADAAGRLMSPATIDRLFGWYWSYLRRLNASLRRLRRRRLLACRALRRSWPAQSARRSVRRGDDFVRSRAARRALRTAMLAKCGLGPDAALLVNIGRHHPEKRVGTAIDAVTKAQQSRPVGLYVIGDGFIHARSEPRRRAPRMSMSRAG